MGCFDGHFGCFDCWSYMNGHFWKIGKKADFFFISKILFYKRFVFWKFKFLFFRSENFTTKKKCFPMFFISTSLTGHFWLNPWFEWLRIIFVHLFWVHYAYPNLEVLNGLLIISAHVTRTQPRLDINNKPLKWWNDCLMDLDNEWVAINNKAAARWDCHVQLHAIGWTSNDGSKYFKIAFHFLRHISATPHQLTSIKKSHKKCLRSWRHIAKRRDSYKL